MKSKLKLKEVGDAASLKTDREERMPLFVSDVQHLLLYSQLGHLSPCTPMRWCHLEKYHQIVVTTVLIVENISLYHYSTYESLFTNLNKFQYKFEMFTPGAYKVNISEALMTVPLTAAQALQLTKSYGPLDKVIKPNANVINLFHVEAENIHATGSVLPPCDKFSRTQLLLSGFQMIEENYPLPLPSLLQSRYKGYVLTKDVYKEVTSSSQMFAIDCEMCLTTVELELTRVSIVEENGLVVYEELVKPKAPIKDYLTQYSGITPKMMKGVTKTLREVQQDLRRIIPPDAILVGQSLSNDFHALKIMHPYVIDTSVIYNLTGDRNRKTKLQVLAQHFLKEKIQSNRKGHCSVEDSLASLNLVKLKLKQDICYGDLVMKNMDVQPKQYSKLQNSCTTLLQEITRMEKTALVVRPHNTADGRVASRKINYLRKIIYLSEDNNDLIISTLCENIGKYSFNVGHVRLTDSELDSDPEGTLSKVNNWIGKIVDSAQASAMHVVVFGGQRESGNGCCFVRLKKFA